MSQPSPPSSNLKRYAWLSIAAAVATIGLKGAAYLMTGSVGLLSEALESIVNLVTAVVALVVLGISSAPPDEDHEFGHDKAEYFSSGLEGALIFVAAISIAVAVVTRLASPRPIEAPLAGLLVSGVATAINLAVARLLITTGRARRSIVLEADGHHLMTDVVTSVGVTIGVTLVAVTKIAVLDPVIALLVAAHILRTGYDLARRSVMGLLDVTIASDERALVVGVLDSFKDEGIMWHALRTRQSGARRFISVHVLVPGDWTVQRGHDILERIEGQIMQKLPGTVTFTHLEPIEDVRAWADEDLPPRSNDPAGASGAD